jgi:hypothetical protein
VFLPLLQSRRWYVYFRVFSISQVIDLRKISFLALLVGGAVSFVTSTVLSFVVAFVTATNLAVKQHLSQPDIIRQLVLANPLVYYGCLSIALVCCIFGGYLAGITAKQAEVINGMASALLMILMGIPFQATDPHPLSIRLLKVVGCIVASGLGGYLRTLQLRRKATRTAAALQPR